MVSPPAPWPAAWKCLPAIGLAVLPLAVGAQEADAVTPTVTVTGKKEAVIRKIDKTVYDVSSLPRAANGSAHDVLQATPEVSVSADGSIAVRGNPQVTVLLDGKPTAITSGSGDERALALQTMSGADIASVEVITNPSAAYNANGGAILNIVLKRNRKPGAHAQLQGSASNQGLWKTGAEGDMTRNGLSLHGSLALRHDGTQKIRQSTVDWINPLSGQTRQTRQSSEVFVRRVVESAALGIDYALNQADSLSLSVRRNSRRSRPVFDVLNEDSIGGAQTRYHRISVGPNEQSDQNASLSYSRQDSGTALKATLQHSETVGLIDKSYRDVFLSPALATGYSRGTSRSARRLSQGTLDWGWPSALGRWGMGLDLQQKTDDIDNYQASVDPASGAERPDAETSNGYAVRTRLAAAYLTDQLRLGKWEMLLGGRAERTALRVGPAHGLAQSRHWQAFNPSVHLQYAHSEQTELSLSYRRSLQMPDARDLNPYTTYIDAPNLSRGNPHPQPQQLTSWEVGANAQAPQLSGSVSLFHRSSRATVTDTRSFADRVLLTSKQNGGRARSVGISGALDWSPDEKLELGADGGVYRVTLSTPDLAALVRQERISAYMNLRAAWRIGQDRLSLDAHVQSASITPLGRSGATSSLNLAWKRQFSKTLSLTVNANDILDGSQRSYRTEASTLRQTGFDHFVARRVYIGLVRKIE